LAEALVALAGEVDALRATIEKGSRR
jgi:hypothetical protein